MCLFVFQDVCNQNKEGGFKLSICKKRRRIITLEGEDLMPWMQLHMLVECNGEWVAIFLFYFNNKIQIISWFCYHL